MSRRVLCDFQPGSFPFWRFTTIICKIRGVQQVFFQPPQTPDVCRAPEPLSFYPHLFYLEDSPNPTENWSQENGLLRTLVKVKITVDEIIIVLMLNVLIWVIVLWLCRRISLFLRNTKINTWQLREIISIYFQMIQKYIMCVFRMAKQIQQNDNNL